MSASKVIRFDSGVPSLFDLCIGTIASNLALYECLQMLPDFVAEQILHKFEKFFEGKNGQVKDSAALVALLQVHDVVAAGGPLAVLNMPWCRSLSDEDARSALQQCEDLVAHLQSVDCSFCERIGDQTVQTLAKLASGMKVLSLTFTAIGDRGVEAVARHCKDLETLSLEQCRNVTDRGIQVLARARLRKLVHLNLGGVSKATNVGFQIVGAHMRQLRSLSLAGCSTLIDYDIEDVCSNCTSLTSLNLRACWRLTDGAATQIAKMARKQSRSLSTSSASPVGEGEGGILLRSLDLGGCKRGTDKGISRICKFAKGLHDIDLRSLSITDDSINSLMTLPHLRSAMLLFTTGVTEEAKQKLAVTVTVPGLPTST